MKMARVIIALEFLGLLSVHAQQYGWREISRPTTNYLTTVEFVDSLHGWTAGRNTILRTTDGGITWVGGIQPYAPSNFFGLSFSDRLHGWAVGRFSNILDAFIWNTTDGGQTWTEQRFVYYRKYSGTAAQSLPRDITVGRTDQPGFEDTATVVKSVDSGATWSESAIADSITSIAKVHFVDSLHGWGTAGYLSTMDSQLHPAILRTIDGGSNWTVVPVSEGYSSVSFIDTFRGWAASGTNSSIFHVLKTADGGLTWTIIYTNVNDIGFDAISFVDSSNGWLFGNAFYQGAIREVIFHTTDGGYNWTQESIGLSEGLQDGQMLDRHHGWTVAFDGRVLAYRLTSDTVNEPKRPERFLLHQNYPNPFNGSTQIEYEIPLASHARITIVDVEGRRISTLVDRHLEPGIYRTKFDGSSIASGTYYYRMETESYNETRQMLLLK